MNVPTIVGLERPEQGRWAVRSRRAFLVVLLLFVLAGLVGLLGVHTATSSSAEAGWTVSVDHATVARAGLDVPWQVTVDHPGGFGKDITLAVTGAYLDIFETQGFFPDASDVTRDGDTLYLTFQAPPGDRFVVAYDAYIQPASQVGSSGTVAVVDAGQRVASVDFGTTLLP